MHKIKKTQQYKQGESNRTTLQWALDMDKKRILVMILWENEKNNLEQVYGRKCLK